jgi:hypothetical protein
VVPVEAEERRQRLKHYRRAQSLAMKRGVQHNAFQFHYREQLLQ